MHRTVISIAVAAFFAVTQLACDTPDRTSNDAPDTTPTGEVAAPAIEEPPRLNLPNRAEPIEGVVTAAQPSQAAVGMLDEAGFGTVINLRPHSEIDWDEAIAADEQGLTYVNIPIAGPDDLTRENVAAFDEALDKGMTDEGKVLVHCGSSNRVGALLALRAKWMEGESSEAALELGDRAGLTSLRPAVEARLAE